MMRDKDVYMHGTADEFETGIEFVRRAYVAISELFSTNFSSQLVSLQLYCRY